MTRLNKSTFATAAFLAAGLAIAGISFAEPPAGGKPSADAKVTKGPAGKGRAERRGPAAGAEGERRGPAGGENMQDEGRPGGRGGMQRGGAENLGKFWENERVAEALKLSDEQTAELNASLDATKASLEAIKGDGKEAQEELRAELEKDNPDVTTVNRLVDQITASQAERMRITTNHKVAVQSILTADQEKALKDARRGGRGGMQGRGQGRGEAAGEGRGERGENMRERFDSIKTREELDAALDGANVPEERRERIIQMWERRQGAGNDAGGADEMGLPPLPPEV